MHLKRITWRVLKYILVFMVILALWNYKMINYGFSQLKGQLGILWNTTPVEEVIKDPGLRIEYREKLLLTEQIRRFAMDSLGLKNSKNYTTYFDQQDKPIMWVVTGCLPYELKAKEWWFPFLGDVSYKGFFVEEKAILEERLVRQEGYETNVYSPSAWSTLGFFKDPIFSNMLKRRPGRLAELIIHELTHATVYLKSSVEFNENLATFIGEKGAEQFLMIHYGNLSKEYESYRGYLSDEIIYSDYMMRSAALLDSLYKSLPEDMPAKEKALKKYRTIAKIMSGIKQLPLSYPERYQFDFKKSRLPNNTEFMSFLRYRNKQDSFSRVFQEIYKSDLRAFISDIVKKSAHDEPLPF